MLFLSINTFLLITPLHTACGKGRVLACVARRLEVGVSPAMSRLGSCEANPQSPFLPLDSTGLLLYLHTLFFFF